MSVRRDISTHDEPRFPIASAMAEAVSASPAHLWTHDFSMLAMALCGCFWRALMTSPCGGRGCPLGRGGGAGATLTTRWPGMFTIPPQAGHLPRRPANSSLKCNTLPQAQVTRIGITGLFRLFGRSQHTVRIGESPIESRRRVDGQSTGRIDQSRQLNTRWARHRSKGCYGGQARRVAPPSRFDAATAGRLIIRLRPVDYGGQVRRSGPPSRPTPLRRAGRVQRKASRAGACTFCTAFFFFRRRG